MLSSYVDTYVETGADNEARQGTPATAGGSVSFVNL
jgi:hypothetical protein